MHNTEKNELIVLKRKVLVLEEQLDEIYYFLKDAVKMRIEMDSNVPLDDVDRFLPNEL